MSRLAKSSGRSDKEDYFVTSEDLLLACRRCGAVYMMARAPPVGSTEAYKDVAEKCPTCEVRDHISNKVREVSNEISSHGASLYESIVNRNR